MSLSIQNRGRRTLEKYYWEIYVENGLSIGFDRSIIYEEKVPTLRDVALHIIRMDVAQSLCTVGELPYGEGRFFAYLPMESIMKAEKGN